MLINRNFFTYFHFYHHHQHTFKFSTNHKLFHIPSTKSINKKKIHSHLYHHALLIIHTPHSPRQREIHPLTLQETLLSDRTLARTMYIYFWALHSLASRICIYATPSRPLSGRVKKKASLQNDALCKVKQLREGAARDTQTDRQAQRV